MLKSKIVKLNHITLLYKTDNPQADEVLQGVIGIFERAFPGRIRGYFLVGSYAIGQHYLRQVTKSNSPEKMRLAAEEKISDLFGAQ